ncbi:hypothetical protein MA16_Dca003627 [Dendrobium catenatum]|uniref:Uncharacterized protein n=1 Tax=Dendrobium catenatum TaxID=906689 RepID=A0A2I0WFH4_9ASPA|nr:hypothetical protein MA16_Dca003627 [Dendrobium catenatum]
MSSLVAAISGTRVEDEDDGENWKRRTVSPASSCGAQTSSASAENSPSAANINLQRDYTLAVQTNSYN